MFWVRGTGATVAVGLVVVCLLLAGGTGLQITELRVPDAIRNGSEASVVLDCDYTLLDGDPEGLVVKWFLNEKDHPSPVYQWIHKQKPQDFGVLKGRLNLEYRASDDEYKMYRAMQITNPTPELSGEYKCTVSTFQNETSQSKRLIVYVPEKNLAVTQTKNDNSAVNVTCSAEGVFPKPSLAIQRQESRADDPEEAHVVQVRTDEGLYDISASVVLEDKHLESPTIFFCELTIPDANYSVKASSTYMPGPPTTTTEEPPTTSTELVTEASLTVGNTAITRSGAPWVLASTLLLCLRL